MSNIATRITALFEEGLKGDHDWMALLISSHLDKLTMPAQGATIERWRALATVAEYDLALAKIYEGHTDALAILSELGDESSSGTSNEASGGLWGVWAAESPGAKVLIERRDDGQIFLSGKKAWCSGAAVADHALLTAWDPDGSGPYLVKVALDQGALEVDDTKWKAIGMASSASLDVTFHGAVAQLVGAEGDYLSRPGFWQGGAGVAACWFGGARGIAKTLLSSARNSGAKDPFKLAALGQVELALEQTAAVMRESARWIDEHPQQDASKVAIRARLSAEACAQLVLRAAGNAMGATPFCKDEKFAKAAADLPVFIRQCHGQKDFVALGERALDTTHAWAL